MNLPVHSSSSSSSSYSSSSSSSSSSAFPSYISGVHHFWVRFFAYVAVKKKKKNFFYQTIEVVHSVFVDGACWACFCSRHLPVLDMNVRIFLVRAMECMCAQTRPRWEWGGGGGGGGGGEGGGRLWVCLASVPMCMFVICHSRDRMKIFPCL